ncbi:Thymidine kinase [Giardia lamblia P15]|uniref:thymidine kinase n=1 Tax=Giardia intestinalis (strain P15) TaxID=658858 RepID=E1EXU2_GIAIA|nr:Thymidine kinase [Giardia lamblia P15]
MNSLTLILGPMFAGKSTELVGIHARLVAARKRVLVVKHTFDTRYDDSSLTTHDNTKIAAKRAVLLGEFAKEFGDYDALIVDEGQFFADIVSGVQDALSKGLYVYVSALSGNFKREPFELIPRLFPLASAIYLRSAICAVCHAPAPFSARFSAQTEEIVIGGAELYAPTCRACWKSIAHQRSIKQARQLTDSEIRNFVSDAAAILERSALTGSKLLLIPAVTSPLDAELQCVYASASSAGQNILVIAREESQKLNEAADTFGFTLRYFDSLVQLKSEDDYTINNTVKHVMNPHSIVLVYHADFYDHADVILDDCVFQGKVVIAATSTKAPYQVLGSFLSHADIVSFGSLTRSTDEGHEKLGASRTSTEVPRFFRTCLTGLPLEKLVLGINEDL